MAQNSLGKILTITSFGESHGPFIGVVIDGFPAGFEIDKSIIQNELNRRRPGQNIFTSTRNEKDEFEIISGIFQNKTTGAPITILIPNTDANPADYKALKNVYRPSHADYTYEKKYSIRDYRGGGRSSARVTAAWVAAGTLAMHYLQTKTKIEIVSWVNSIYTIEADVNENSVTRNHVDNSAIRCPDEAASAIMESEIELARSAGDSLGGTIRCIIRNCPVGLGEPVFGKLNARLANALFAINAVKGIEFGDGFAMTQKKGSSVNDAFENTNGKIHTLSNHSGGVQGGISNGEHIRILLAFKPTSTLKIEQKTVTQMGENTSISAQGRHDPCVLPRAVPIVDAMLALTLLDLYLEAKIMQ